MVLLASLAALRGRPVTDEARARVVGMVALVALATVLAVRHLVWASVPQASE
jgi:hypothetical protein